MFCRSDGCRTAAGTVYKQRNRRGFSSVSAGKVEEDRRGHRYLYRRAVVLFLQRRICQLLFAVCLTASIVLSASVWLAGDPYRKMWKQPLIFDEQVKRQVTLSYAQQQKKAHLANLTGIVLISTGLLLMPLLAPGAGASIDDLLLAAGMVLAGIGIFLCIYLTGILRAYRLLVMNEIYRKEKIK